MEQKVIQVGNSLAITLPSQFVKNKKIKAGQKVFVHAGEIVEVHTDNTKPSRLTPEFHDWMKKFNNKYKDALTELAKK